MPAVTASSPSPHDAPRGLAAAQRRVLLVEDEPGLVLTLTDRLTAEGYEVLSATDGPGGLAVGLREPVHVILLDVMLPGMSGFDICRELRRQGVKTPVIMLTARGQVVDKVLGLRIGADDYLTKPFDMMELVARIEVQLRRVSAFAGAAEYRFGDVTVNFRKAEVARAGVALELSAREFLLLKYFVEHREATLSRDELLNEVWGYQTTPTTRTVDVHVAWLRQKIEPNPRHPQYVLTVHGMGYKFVG
jgi:DNA-binding response OmpR family regulator